MKTDNQTPETEYELTWLQWIQRAKDTLDVYTKKHDDTQILDAFDDICNALELLQREENLREAWTDQRHLHI